MAATGLRIRNTNLNDSMSLVGSSVGLESLFDRFCACRDGGWAFVEWIGGII